MEYIKRIAERKFNMLNSMFQVVLVCGPRQVGKKNYVRKTFK